MVYTTTMPIGFGTMMNLIDMQVVIVVPLCFPTPD
jgi:hypothetical protein